MKPKRIKLKDAQRESIALFDFAIAEAYARGTDVHYRISFPYGPIGADDKMSPTTKLVVDFSVSFDASLEAEPKDAKQPIQVSYRTKRKH